MHRRGCNRKVKRVLAKIKRVEDVSGIAVARRQRGPSAARLSLLTKLAKRRDLTRAASWSGGRNQAAFWRDFITFKAVIALRATSFVTNRKLDTL